MQIQIKHKHKPITNSPKPQYSLQIFKKHINPTALPLHIYYPPTSTYLLTHQQPFTHPLIHPPIHPLNTTKPRTYTKHRVPYSTVLGKNPLRAVLTPPTHTQHRHAERKAKNKVALLYLVPTRTWAGIGDWDVGVSMMDG